MAEWRPGDEVILAHPREEFAAFQARGYGLRFLRTPERPDECLQVEALHGGQVIGRADFGEDRFACHCQNVRVEEAHQRRGVATALYLFAEAALGKRLWNFWAGDPAQSPAAQAMWANPSRPFGRRPPPRG